MTEEDEDTTLQDEEYMSVTVIFTDIPNYQAVANTASVFDLMATMNKLWAEYDLLCQKWKVQRVQTVNDQFLGVSGIPDRCPDHAENAIQFSIALIQMVQNFCGVNGERLLVRVGLNSGPVTAGIVGGDQWTITGDTVNVSSRMETTSQPMRIHLTEATYKLVSSMPDLKIEGPEIIDVKGKGPMPTYWIA
ncbi:UNVERIFIED_CONTAM: hypothetical protein HDU68_010305 [Siphonaria sp. JEL0065]|nr:hypothetical protein HDU68_010305 [Siphonaria sp. JEL0065]